MKKSYFVVMAAALLLSVSAVWASGKRDTAPAADGELPKTNRLVIYSNTAEGFTGYAIPAFEAKYGVRVELISASGGEILNRLKAEQGNPIADIVLGGGRPTFETNIELFDPYFSPELASVDDRAKDPDGYFTGFEYGVQPLMINRDVVGKVEIRGYADLLKPELRKKIVLGDASKSNSALIHLLQMLDGYAIMEGKRYESDSGWSYVQELLKHSVMLSSSGSIHKAVADGEYGVALTWENPVITYLQDGAKNLEIVYPRECQYFGPSSVQIVHGGKNKLNAQLFVDFILSEECQTYMGQNTSSRPVRKNVKLASFFPSLEQIQQEVGKNLFARPDDFIAPNSARIQKKFTDVMTDVLQ
jgi:iron(III) transport system substrate-binding protein